MFTPTVQKYLAILTALKGARSLPIANLMLRNFETSLSHMLTLNVVERTSHGIDVQHVLYTDCGMAYGKEDLDKNINDTSKTRDNPICSSTKVDKPESVQQDCKQKPSLFQGLTDKVGKEGRNGCVSLREREK